MCLEIWKEKKRNQKMGKNPFNFVVPNAERHPFDQLPITEQITFADDDKHKADVLDSSKNNLNPSKAEKNIPPYPPADPAPSESVKQRFVYAPAMVGIKQFDKKYKLPKQQKKAKTQKTPEEIKAQKEKLEAELAENDLKMKIINKNKNISKKNV